LRLVEFYVLFCVGPEERRLKRTADDITALLDEHGGRLFALLYRLTLRSDVAEDLLQELFCRLSQSTGFQRAENPAAFAYRTATNLAFDWRRQRKRNPATDRVDDDFVAPDASPLADLVQREDLELTLNALGELPAAGREILVLRYLQQQSYESIAMQLGKTTHQVRAIAFKAIKRLRELLLTGDHEPAGDNQNVTKSKNPG
jgi:RNA polymerase sigma factor (sigma-70 family)